MSKYTTELRFICESLASYSDQQGLSTIDDVLDKAIPKIFDFDYPIYDGEYKPVLERKILMHYYTREICCETYARWKLFLREKLNLIMPYYNQRYKSATLEFNPLHDVDLTINKNKQTSGDNTGNSNSTQTVNTTQNTDRDITANTTDTLTGKETERFSDTPQGGLNGIENNNYLTTATITDTDNTNTRNGTTTDSTDVTGNSNTNTQTNTTGNYKDTEEYIESITGKNVGTSYSDLIMKYRDTFINVDAEIIDELKDLFICLW